MALVIRGAPAPGWYFPVGEAGKDMVPYLVTDVVRPSRGGGIQGFAVSIYCPRGAARHTPMWLPARKLVQIADPAKYVLVEKPPDEWRGQDIRAAVAKAEERAGWESKRHQKKAARA